MIAMEGPAVDCVALHLQLSAVQVTTQAGNCGGGAFHGSCPLVFSTPKRISHFATAHAGYEHSHGTKPGSTVA